MIVGLHLKHVRFASIAARHNQEISTYQSLTIWKAREELNKSISDYTGLSGAHVARVVEAFAFAPRDIAVSIFFRSLVC
jgi:hypothetical protein